MEDEGGAYAGRKVGSKNVSKGGCRGGTHRVNGGGRSGPGVPEGGEPGGNAQDGAQVGVARAAVANQLVAHTVLLFGEGQGDKRGSEEVGGRALEGVEGPRPNPQLNVLKAKLGASPIGWGNTQVLARPEQEKETQDEALGGGLCQGGGIELGEGPHLSHDRKREGLDAGGRGVSSTPRTIESSEADVEVAVAV